MSRGECLVCCGCSIRESELSDEAFFVEREFWPDLSEIEVLLAPAILVIDLRSLSYQPWRTAKECLIALLHWMVATE
jgi:hypothetical protein